MWLKLLKNNLIYAVGSLANSAALLLLVPFLVNNLKTEEYGVYSICEIIILLLSILISLGMDVGLMREYWFLETDVERSRLSGTVLLAVMGWGVIFFGILVAGYALLHELPGLAQFHLEAFQPVSLILVYAISFSETIFNVFLAIFRICEQPIQYVCFSVGKMVLFLLGAIEGVKIVGNFNGALLGRLLASTVGILVAVLFSYRMIRLEFDWKQFKRVLNYGSPLVISNLSNYILQNSDRYILTGSSTLIIVAIYSFVYKVASGWDVLINRPFSTDWAARRFRIATQEDASQKYADVFIFYLFIGSLAALGLILISPLLFQWVAPASYAVGLQILPVLLLGILFFGLSSPLNVGLVIKDKTSIVAKIGVIAAIFCLAVEFILIPRYGMVGAAWSTLLAYAVWTAGIAFSSLKVYPVPYDLRKIAEICLAALLGFLGIQWLNQWPINAYFTLILGLAWLVVVYGLTGVRLTRRQPLKLTS